MTTYDNGCQHTPDWSCPPGRPCPLDKQPEPLPMPDCVLGEN